MSALAFSLAAAVIAAAIYGGSSVLQAAATGSGTAVTDLVRSPGYLAGLAGDLAAWLLSLVALRHLPLFVVQSVLAASLAVTAAVGSVVLARRPARSDVLATALLVAAVAVLAAAGGHQAAVPASAGVTAGLLAGAGALAVLTLAARRSGPTGWALLSGVAFSGAALAARVLHGSLISQPLAYAVVVFGALGAYGYAQALEEDGVTAVTGVTGIVWAVEVAVPAVVGVGALGDSVRPGWWPAAVVALVVVLAATAVLAARPLPAAGTVSAARSPAGRAAGRRRRSRSCS